jgi:hypothetical protein
LDPQKTKDGKPYGPVRYQEIVRERYFVTKNSGVSYEDTGKMTPTERQLYVNFIVEEFEKTKRAMEEAQQKARESQQKNKSNRARR